MFVTGQIVPLQDLSIEPTTCVGKEAVMKRRTTSGALS
jgi:hypothetical protein